MPVDIGRVVALGGSNLTRGFPTLVSTARASWGPDVEVLAALGHGRAYGVRSRFIVVNAGLAALSATRGARFLKPKPDWYGFDPIHIRPSCWRPAWREILGGEPEGPAAVPSRLDGLRLYLRPPERRWICGVEQFTAQPGVTLPSGGRIWTY